MGFHFHKKPGSHGRTQVVERLPEAGVEAGRCWWEVQRGSLDP